MVDVDSLVNVKNGTQAKRIFWDEEIYKLELTAVQDSRNHTEGDLI